MNEKFYTLNDFNGNFEFTDKHKTDIEFFILGDCVIITIDEHSRDWDNPGRTSVQVDKADWPEFVKHVNNLKVI